MKDRVHLRDFQQSEIQFIYYKSYLSDTGYESRSKYLIVLQKTTK